MSSYYCGESFEELSLNEMQQINGGGLELTITTWSTLPCSAGAVISGTIALIVVTVSMIVAESGEE